LLAQWKIECALKNDERLKECPKKHLADKAKADLAEKADCYCEKTCERNLVAYGTHDTSQQDVKQARS